MSRNMKNEQHKIKNVNSITYLTFMNCWILCTWSAQRGLPIRPNECRRFTPKGHKACQ